MKIIFVVITARPSYSRIKTYLEELKKSEKYTLKIVLVDSPVFSIFPSLSFIVPYPIAKLIIIPINKIRVNI